MLEIVKNKLTSLAWNHKDANFGGRHTITKQEAETIVLPTNTSQNMSPRMDSTFIAVPINVPVHPTSTANLTP